MLLDPNGEISGGDAAFGGVKCRSFSGKNITLAVLVKAEVDELAAYGGELLFC